MFDFVRKRLALKIALVMTLISVPLAATTIWLVVTSEMDAAESAILQKGRVAAVTGATAYGQILEAGVASGELKLEDLVDPKYEEIVYPSAWKLEARSYHTGFDRFTDGHGIQQIEDSILLDKDFEFASGIDANGYVPTTVGKYQVEPTGDPVHDRLARKKRRYNTVNHLVAARHVGAQPLVQPYTQRETGRVLWDVAAEITVRGKHFGAFRVGVSRDQITERGRELAARLALVVGAALTLLIACAVALVQLSMRPLTRLVGRATRLSEDCAGDELNEPIREPYADEVGQMARALDRLRQSVRASVRLLDGRTT